MTAVIPQVLILNDLFLMSIQELEEPGPEESSRFDMICPTVVRPKSSTLTSATKSLPGGNVSVDEVGIVRQFTFSSSLQRMSVIIRKLSANNFDLYCKGAPEMIVSLCDVTSGESANQEKVDAIISLQTAYC